MGLFSRDRSRPLSPSSSSSSPPTPTPPPTATDDGGFNLEAGVVEIDDECAGMMPPPPSDVADDDFDDDDDDFDDDDDESGIPPPPPPPPTTPPPAKSSSSHYSAPLPEVVDARSEGEDGMGGMKGGGGGGGRRMGGRSMMFASIAVALALIGTGLGVGLGIDWEARGGGGGIDSSANEAAVDGFDADVMNAPTTVPVVEDTYGPTSTPTIVDTTSPSSSSIAACPESLDSSHEIDAGVAMRYAISDGLFCCRIEATNDGNGWIGLGFSTDGMMSGSQAVIGIPDVGTVLKYELTNDALVMDDDKQTLLFTNIDVNDDGLIVMEFAKYLTEDGEVDVIPGVENRMIYAMGNEGDQVGYHWMRTSFVIDLPSSSDTTTETETSSTVVTAVDDTIYDAIVIGAGWAGIRAIETLNIEGISSVLVLEATNAIGGRCRTINDGGSTNDPSVESDVVPYDTGSDWLYSGTRMSDALDAEGYLDGTILSGPIDTSIPMGLGTGTFYRQSANDDDNSAGLTTSALDDAISTEMVDTVWGGFHDFRDNRIDEMDGMSYEEAIDWYIQRWGYTDDEVIDFLDFMKASVEIENAGDSSALDISKISFFPPGYAIDSYYMGVPGEGFGNVAARYAEPYASSIRLNSRVIDVDSDAESDVTLVTYIGEDGGTTVVKAKTVLVTVSLGVLKAGAINFVPALPENKTSSIQGMGFGLINKCILSWKDDSAVVWPKDEMWFMLITPDEEASGRWTTFFNPTSLKGKPTLTSFVAGDDAVAMEDQTDEEVLEAVMTNLRAMFPDIPDPDGFIVTRWGLEENFLGAHSFPVPGRDIAEDSAVLSETYGRIYFAGEATDAWWGTTIGAWNSGEDQALAMAQRLLGA